MKIKTNMFFCRLNNEFANILQKVRSLCFIRAWAFIRDFTVIQFLLKVFRNFADVILLSAFLALYRLIKQN